MPRRAETSAKAERDQLRERMRALGCSIPQIVVEMARRFGLRPRLAWRHALGWPQWKLAQQYNTAHPGAKLSDHRISEYEVWPHGGNPPSLRYLAKLATTYGHGCTPSHLVDADDLEHLTPADRCLLTTSPTTPITTTPRASTQLPTLMAGQSATGLVVADPSGWATAMALHLPDTLTMQLMTCLESLAQPARGALGTARERDRAYHQLVQLLQSWARTMDRRNAIRLLGWATAAASLLPAINSDEYQRVASVLSTSNRVDAQTIEHIEEVLRCCARQDDTLGPQAALNTVLAQRDLARGLMPECPIVLRPRMLSAVSKASDQAGWLSFDLNQFDNAGYYYEDARALAHEAENTELSAFVLCHMSHLATWRGAPRTGIDHAVAAGQWAHRTGDLRLQAYTAEVAARAYAADGQRHACLRALDTAHTALTAADDQSPYYLQFYDEALHISFRGECHLRLSEADRAVSYAQQSLETLDRSRARNVAMTILDLGEAYAQCREIDEAARLLGDAGDLAARNSSARLIERLKQGRTELQPWQNTTAVRHLDDRLASYNLT